jgi:predicted permease
MDTLLQELRHALRRLAQTPLFAATAVAILGLGIGANATVFAWARAILLDPIPGAAEGGRLVQVRVTDRNEGFVSFSHPDYRDVRERVRRLSGIVAVRPVAAALGTEHGAQRVFVQIVSGNFFEVLGVRPLLGRTLTSEDDRSPDGHAVVVFSHGLWERAFGGDASLVGRTVRLNNRPYTVLGVTPPDFRGSTTGLAYEAWVPMMMQERFEPGGRRLDNRSDHFLDAFARIAPGASLAGAQAELETLGRQLAAAYPDDWQGRGLAAYPLWRAPRSVQGLMGPVLLILAAVTGLVLLLACANLAGLLLARALGRRREFAIRLSLGARRIDLLRQLLAESLVLAAGGGLAGVLVAVWGVGLLERFLPPTDFPVRLGAVLDGPVLGLAMFAALASSVVFGLAPAFQATRSETAAAIREAAGASAAWNRSRLRKALVAGQLAASAVLLVAAGLFLRSLHNIQAYDLGFEPRGVLLASLELFTSGYDEPRGVAFYRELLERARALPGVTGATLVRRAPLGIGGYSSTSPVVEGYVPRQDETPFAYVNHVGPGYFRTLRMPLVAGRDFGPQDDAGAPRVAIVNETMARRYWSGREALGGRFRIYGDSVTVVGVAKDGVYRDVGETPGPWCFLPVYQSYRPAMTLAVRSAADPAGLAASVSDLARSLDPSLALFGVRSFEDHLQATDFRQRLGSQALGAFGALGLVLAAVGLYGVLASSVVQRSREIGIRMALGGARRDVFRMVVGQGLRLAAAGLAAGLLLAAAGARGLASLLVGVAALDAATFAAVAVTLLVVAGAACALPARKAMLVDPITALRHE